MRRCDAWRPPSPRPSTARPQCVQAPKSAGNSKQWDAGINFYRNYLLPRRLPKQVMNRLSNISQYISSRCSGTLSGPKEKQAAVTVSKTQLASRRAINAFKNLLSQGSQKRNEIRVTWNQRRVRLLAHGSMKRQQMKDRWHNRKVRMAKLFPRREQIRDRWDNRKMRMAKLFPRAGNAVR